MKGNTKHPYEYKSFYDCHTSKWVIKIKSDNVYNCRKWVLFSSMLYETEIEANNYIKRELKNRHDLWQR
jgi:hypothetical protein